MSHIEDLQLAESDEEQEYEQPDVEYIEPDYEEGLDEEQKHIEPDYEEGQEEESEFRDMYRCWSQYRHLTLQIIILGVIHSMSRFHMMVVVVNLVVIQYQYNQEESLQNFIVVSSL